MACSAYFGLMAWGLMALVNGQVTDRWDLWWNYQPGVSGPSSWGGFNPKWKLCSVGQRQSPIDITPRDLLYDSNLKHITLNKHKVSGVLKNTGHDLTIDIDRIPHEIRLSDGPLSYQYLVNKIVVHFGSNGKQGSEHRIDGKSFPAEVQIYGYNDQFYTNASSAEEANFGVAAISLLVAVNDSSSSAIGQILNDASTVQYRGTEKSLAKFSIHELLPETRNYITYEGSLTKPGCYETVTWVVMNKPIFITSQQLNILRQTVSTDAESPIKTALADNYRPIQNLNRRALRTNINFPQQKSSACDIKREKSYTVNEQLTTVL